MYMRDVGMYVGVVCVFVWLMNHSIVGLFFSPMTSPGTVLRYCLKTTIVVLYPYRYVPVPVPVLNM
jgi:hypothetical protein